MKVKEHEKRIEENSFGKKWENDELNMSGWSKMKNLNFGENFP